MSEHIKVIIQTPIKQNNVLKQNVRTYQGNYTNANKYVMKCCNEKFNNLNIASFYMFFIKGVSMKYLYC